MGEGENMGWQGQGRSVMKKKKGKKKPVNRSIEATAYIQIHRRKKNTRRQSFPGKSSSLMRIYSAPLCDKQLFCSTDFLTDSSPGPLNRISILFQTPAQKLFVYIEGGKILKSDICLWFRHILGNHLESSFVTMVTFLFSSLSWLRTLAFPILYCFSKGQMSLKKT